MKKNTNGSPIRLYYVTQVSRGKGKIRKFFHESLRRVGNSVGKRIPCIFFLLAAEHVFYFLYCDKCRVPLRHGNA